MTSGGGPMSDRETGEDVLRDLLQWAVEDCRISADRARTIAASYTLTNVPPPTGSAPSEVESRGSDVGR